MATNNTSNNFATAKWIVATAGEGTHTTITSALTSASSGDTIFIKPGTYTENLTLKVGVNLTAFGSDSSLNGTAKVIINGTCTLTTAGSVTISGIQLQTNSAALLAVTGSAASIVNLENCYLNITNNTAITYSSSSASSRINIFRCEGDITTTGISILTHSSAGTFSLNYSDITNTGLSTTASIVSSGIFSAFYSSVMNPITTSSTGVFISQSMQINCIAINTTALTIGGGDSAINAGTFAGGTASAISISSFLNLAGSAISSSNTNAITGAGSVSYCGLKFTGSSSTINTTTQAGEVFRPGITRSDHQPAFLATTNTQTDVTGDGTVYTVLFANEIYDQDSNFASPTFTAPVTGRYLLTATIGLSGLIAGHTSANAIFVSSNRSVAFGGNSGFVSATAAGISRISGSVIMDMDVSDTCTITTTVSGGTKVVDIEATNTTFSACLLC